MTILSVGEDLEELELSFTAGVYKILQSLWKTFCHFLKTLNIYLLYEAAIPFQHMHPIEIEAYVHKDMQNFK